MVDREKKAPLLSVDTRRPLKATLAGVTLFDALLDAPVPIAFTAATVKVYERSLVSQLIIIGLSVHVNEISHGDDVTT